MSFHPLLRGTLLLSALLLALATAGCGGKDAAPAAPSKGKPLKKDPAVPLLIVAKQSLGGLWCPSKVIGPDDGDCPQIDRDRKTCRNNGEAVRWLVLDADTLEFNASANFSIEFKNPKAAIFVAGTKDACGKSSDGELDCVVMEKSGEFKYTVAMKEQDPACPVLDPRIYINQSRD